MPLPLRLPCQSLRLAGTPEEPCSESEPAGSEGPSKGPWLLTFTRAGSCLQAAPAGGLPFGLFGVCVSREGGWSPGNCCFGIEAGFFSLRCTRVGLGKVAAIR